MNSSFALNGSLRRAGVRFIHAVTALAWGVSLGVCGAADPPTLVIPTSKAALHLNLPLPPDREVAKDRSWQLVEKGRSETAIPAEITPEASGKGLLVERGGCLTAIIPPPMAGTNSRVFNLVEVAKGTGAIQPAGPAFRFAEVNTNSLGLWEGNKPVFVYNHGTISKAGVPADRNRSTYIHPLYGLDGEVITDDFPRDHYHHRGLFWAWPHVRIGEHEYDLWAITNIYQRFEHWQARQAGKVSATLSMVNGWYVGNQRVMDERIWLQVYAASAEGRFIDVACTWAPCDQPVTLAGAEGKSYGGLTLRFAPQKRAFITTPLGESLEDLAMTRLAWADLSAQFSGAAQPSGAAIFVASDHPDYPPMWLTRHYGVLCLGWPGTQPRTFSPGEAVTCRYQVWIHRDRANAAQLTRLYQAYEAGPRTFWR